MDHSPIIIDDSDDDISSEAITSANNPPPTTYFIESDIVSIESHPTTSEPRSVPISLNASQLKGSTSLASLVCIDNVINSHMHRFPPNLIDFLANPITNNFPLLYLHSCANIARPNESNSTMGSSFILLCIPSS